MKPFQWNKEKNRLLKQNRQITFDEIVNAINSGSSIEVYDHPDQIKYP